MLQIWRGVKTFLPEFSGHVLCAALVQIDKNLSAKALFTCFGSKLLFLVVHFLFSSRKTSSSARNSRYVCCSCENLPEFSQFLTY